MPAKIHGASNKKSSLYNEYQIWKGIKRRCYNKNCKDYPLYGGKGITVSDKWINDFSTFIEDMGPRPSKIHSIDRINSDLGYTKKNCKWVTPKEQSRNRKCVKMISFNGESKSLVEWAKSLGINRTTLQMRFRYGWSIEKALSKKVGA